MSNRPRRIFIRKMKAELSGQGTPKKGVEDPMDFQQLSEEEAKRQFLYSIIAAFLLVLLFIALPMSF